MPKYCSVPNCRSDSGGGGERKSFYKFPLQDPARLQQWLRNMGRENWSPSRHQYVCHEHFAPSCFKVRWGIRYLDSDAVPTVFLEPEKRKAADPCDRKPKRLRADQSQSFPPSADTAPDPVEMQSEPQTLRLFEFSVDPTQQRDGGPLQTGVDSQASAEAAMAGGNGPPALYQSVGDVVSGGGGAEVVLMSESSAEGGRVQLVNGIAAAILSRGGALVLNELVPAAPPELQDLSTQEFLQLHEGQQVVAYFETIPSVFPSGASTQFTFPPDTVLSSALSAEPISSTVPIVSKHAPSSSSSLALSLERLDGEEAEEGEGVSDPDGTEQDDQQLGEHSYHKNSLSKEQLEAVVTELQKKVKVLQQRHRRHLEKLLGLENTVSQLRQSNTLNEERLQLLERAYLQSSASDAGETVAIIYEEDDGAYFYTPLNDAGAPLSLDNK